MLFFFFFIIILLMTCNPSSEGYGVITVRILHHNSIHSPLYNPLTSMRERGEFDFMSSLHRAAFYLQLQTDTSWTVGSRLSNLGGYGFLARMEVGSQNMEQLVIMDTGSGLLWINCEPCTYNAIQPVFDPKRSTSYGITDCITTDACDAAGGVSYTCNYRNRKNQEICKYSSYFAGGQFTRGTLSVENFKFQNSSRVFRSLVFGCSHDTNFFHINGILGLARTSFSILRQKQYSKFSYCIGDLGDPSFPHDKLIIGDILNTGSPRTIPMVSGGGDYHYYVNLVAIYIASYKLEIDPEFLRRDTYYYTGGTLIDSGSTYTFFPREVYDKFEEVVIAAVYAESKNSLERNYSFKFNKGTRVCYDGVFDTELTTFPIVRLVFEGGAVMRLAAKHLFQQVTEESFCLAVLPIDLVVERGTFSILGSLMQQFLYIGYDLDKENIVFQQNADCSLIG